MDTDYRALCAELLNALDGWHQAVFETGTGWVRPDEVYLLDRARAALAAPDGPAVPEGREPASVVGEPSDEELLKLARAELNNSPNWEEPEYDASNPFPYEAPGIAWLNFARAVLARFGNQPAPAPAEGDVAELVAWLRGANWDSKRQTLATRAADLLEGLGSGWVVPTVEQPAPPAAGEVAELVAWLRQRWPHLAHIPNSDYAMGVRAADLLEQRHPAPVPVSERLPGPEDCDGEERCWLLVPRWILPPFELTHWLPAHALPLPTDADQPPA